MLCFYLRGNDSTESKTDETESKNEEEIKASINKNENEITQLKSFIEKMNKNDSIHESKTEIENNQN